MSKKKKILFIVFAALIIIAAIFWLSIKPSNNRNWNDDQTALPYAEFVDDRVHVHNVRNFIYSSTDKYIKNYYSKTYDLTKIKNLYYIVEPFSEWDGAAHTFFSFEFEDDTFVSISVEIRKEKGESFSALKGILKQYEIMYVVGDEKDLVKLRSNFRKDDVFMYPVDTSKQKIKKLFVNMLTEANELKKKPKFYNTLTNTCTTNIVKHANIVSPNKIPFDYRILAPGYSDRFAYELGLIKKHGTFEETRAYYKINELAEKFANDDNFSRLIRKK